MKWRHLNKPRPPSKGYKMSSLVVGAWHSWQQLCQIEEQVLWPGRQPNPSRRTSLTPTFSPSFSPAKFISKCKAASKWLLLFPLCKMEKPYSSTSLEPTSLREKKSTSLDWSWPVGLSLACCLFLSGGKKALNSWPCLWPGQSYLKPFQLFSPSPLLIIVPRPTTHCHKVPPCLAYTEPKNPYF